MWSKAAPRSLFLESLLRSAGMGRRIMSRFTAQEMKLIAKLRQAPNETALELREACPRHSACVPLPLFRVSRISEEGFQAQWNSHHLRGPNQSFRFDDVLPA